MAKVKQEVKEELLTSDASLLQWVEHEKEDKLFGEPQSKMDIKKIETKVEGDASEHESGAQDEIGKNNQLLSQSRTGKKEGKHVSQSKMAQLEARNMLMQKEVSTMQNDLNSKTQSLSLQPWRKTLESAVVSENVESLCEYQCPKCRKVYSESSNLSKHYTKTSHVIIKRGELNNYLIKIVAHQCHMCDKNLLCDSTVLSSHVVKHHKISLKEYVAKCNIKHITEKNRRKEEFKLCYLKHADWNNFSNSVGNLCKFACFQCEFICQGWQTMTRHIYRAKHGPYQPAIKHTVKATFHRCKLCDELLLCDNYIVANHVRIHSVTITQYKKKVCFLNQTDNEPETQYKSAIKQYLKHVPAICSKPQIVLKQMALPKFQVTKDTGNICFFNCPSCTKTDMSYSGLRTHCKRKHKFIKCFNAKNIVEARYHECHICAKIILCDNYFLSAHLSRSHKMRLSQYNTDYVLKNGNIVFPTMKEFLSNPKVFESLKFTTTKNANQTIYKEFISADMISSESEDSDS